MSDKSTLVFLEPRDEKLKTIETQEKNKLEIERLTDRYHRSPEETIILPHGWQMDVFRSGSEGDFRTRTRQLERSLALQVQQNKQALILNVLVFWIAFHVVCFVAGKAFGGW